MELLALVPPVGVLVELLELVPPVGVLVELTKVEPPLDVSPVPPELIPPVGCATPPVPLPRPPAAMPPDPVLLTEALSLPQAITKNGVKAKTNRLILTFDVPSTPAVISNRWGSRFVVIQIAPRCRVRWRERHFK